MKYLLASAILAFMAGGLGGMAFQEWLDAPVAAHTCLPEDKCILYIVPYGKPWLALTCDLQTNKCEDSKP